MPFVGDDDVAVEQIDDVSWDLLRRLTYKGKKDRFVVPRGMNTDFASIPRVFTWFLPRYGKYTKAAVLHDYLWRRKAVAGEISWIDADAIFRRAMRELDVAFLRRWIMWAAVRWGALLKKGGLDGWWRESWRVVLITLLALPILLPPAAVILVSLLAFYLLELLFWAPLKLASLRQARPDKEVVMPSVKLKS
jgi:hypothetical protein